MKKRTRRILIVLGAMSVFALVAIAWLAFALQGELKSMSPLETRALDDGVFAVRNDFVNMYLVRGEDSFIAIDAGSDAALCAQELKKLGIDPLAVKAVFLTHSDYDHTAALALFRNARLYLSRDEVRMVDGSTSRLPFMKNRVDGPREALRDGQIIGAAGLKIACIASPGHTPGSMCFLVNDALLFTGDTISLKNGRAGTFVSFFNMDGETQKTSIRRLAGLAGVRAVFTAHHGMSDDFAGAFDGWRN
jgi:hydroxyacylglutathione hydrolase